MSTDTIPETTITDVVELSPELREGDSLIDGQIRLYDVTGDDTLESDAARFFDRTLLTDGLEDSLKRLRDTLNGEDRTRIHELYGPYGTGKSHQMVALYHCFASPSVVGDWAEEQIEGLGAALPTDAEPIVVSLQKHQFDYLWEPLFDALGYDLAAANYDEEGGYPTIDVIADAVGDRTVAFFVDELEDFFDSLTGRREAANRGFLQALCEASTRPDTALFPVVSVLREESTVQDILSRQERVEVNMSNQVSISDVLRHRLVGEVRDGDRLQALVQRYVDAYERTDHVDLQPGFREELTETYPFHPRVIEALRTRYAAGSESGTRRTAGGEEVQSGPTRGMLHLFARVLVDNHETTDLITHGEVDAVEYNDELGRINIQHSRPDRCYEDIVQRLDGAGIDHGREILSTVLIHSLTPGLDEGATKDDVIVGTFHAGDRVNDIVVDLQRLQGAVYHLWTDDDDDRYVVREDENPRSLVRTAARDVSDDRALGVLGRVVESVFGAGAHAVGFDTNERLAAVPDDKRVKTVVKNGPWSESEVAAVVKNPPEGRQWRNTLVFVQPSGDTEIGPGGRREKYLGKAKEVVGARLRKEDQNFSAEIREAIAELETEYETELEDRVRGAYGDVLDTDDPLNNFANAATMDLEAYTGTTGLPTAREIAAGAQADPFDLRRHAEAVLDDRLAVRDAVTVTDVYERFLRDPSRPIPADETAVADALAAAVDGDEVLAHRDDGFTAAFESLDTDATLIAREDVTAWSDDDVASALRETFGRGDDEIRLGAFEHDLRERTDVWVAGQPVREAVATAAKRLAAEDQYVLVAGTELLDRPQPDAALRDVSDAGRISTETVRDRIVAAATDRHAVDTADVLAKIRNDSDVYLPADETERAFRGAVTELLDGGYRILADGSYHSRLGDSDPTAVTLAPFPGDDTRERIREYVAGVPDESTFGPDKVQAAVPAEVSTEAVTNALLADLPADTTDTEYVIAASKTQNPADWNPGSKFRVPSEDGWTFEYDGDDPEEMRAKWDDERDSGSVSYATISFNGVAPGLSVVSFETAETKLSLTEGTAAEDVEELLRRIPEDATSLSVTIQFDR